MRVSACVCNWYKSFDAVERGVVDKFNLCLLTACLRSRKHAPYMYDVQSVYPCTFPCACKAGAITIDLCCCVRVRVHTVA